MHVRVLAHTSKHVLLSLPSGYSSWSYEYMRRLCAGIQLFFACPNAQVVAEFAFWDTFHKHSKVSRCDLCFGRLATRIRSLGAAPRHALPTRQLSHLPTLISAPWPRQNVTRLYNVMYVAVIV